MKDKIVAKGKWKFNEEVTDVFDNMLERSIPDYNNMRYLVKKLSYEFMKNTELPSNTIIDIGSSRGRALKDIYKKDSKYNYIGIEISKPMYESCVNEWKDNNNINFYNYDLKNYFPKLSRPDNILTLSILTLCFVPIEYRLFVLNNIYKSLSIGGGLIVVEKCLPNNFETSSYFDNVYYNMKKENNYSQEEINAKRKSLEGVLVPLTNSFNEELFKSAGFKKIDIFWKTLNFTGWVLIK